MASLMLEEELRYYMQRGGGGSHGSRRGKQSGKSRDALFRSGGQASAKIGIGQPHKGIAGLST